VRGCRGPVHTGPITGGAEKFSWPVRRASSVNEPLFGRCRFEDRDGEYGAGASQL
jgi:hypothetical protein